MAPKAAPIAPGPCDMCDAEIAPFGYAPPPGSGIKVARPLRSCAAEACRATAARRRASLVDRNGASLPARRDRQGGDLFDR